jgi:hypothetical protein
VSTTRIGATYPSGFLLSGRSTSIRCHHEHTKSEIQWFGKGVAWISKLIRREDYLTRAGEACSDEPHSEVHLYSFYPRRASLKGIRIIGRAVVLSLSDRRDRIVPVAGWLWSSRISTRFTKPPQPALGLENQLRFRLLGMSY